MDRRFQNELDYYLNSPIPETSQKLSSDNIKRDSSTSLENVDISLLTSLHFESKDDLTSCSPSDTIHRDSSSSTQNSDILPFTSSHFESEDDSTSCLSSFESNDDLTCISISDKINFDPEIFENHIFVATSDLESVNSDDFEDED